MNRLSYLILLFSFIFMAGISAQTINRQFEIKEPSNLERGFGAVVAGVDFDNDGWPEIYAVNTNMIDEPYELVPRIYKFEWNGTSWDSVWGAVAPVELQNTWPTLNVSDLDGDGRPELLWGIVNNFGTNLNPPRYLVYEYPADGSDNMGVSDGFGGFTPNASTEIVFAQSLNVRPVTTVVQDIDNDNKQEVIFADRAAGAGGVHCGILSVSDVPNNGGGTETWTTEFIGLDNPAFAGTGNKWDVIVLNNTVYLFDGNLTDGSRVHPVKNVGGTWTVMPSQGGIAGGNSSFKGAKVVDINNDGTQEALVAEWLGNTIGQGARVWLVQQQGDTLISTELGNMEALGAVRLNGADYGDVDGDGKLDFIMGSRYDANNTARVPVFRLEHQGGDIANPANWTASIADSGYWEDNGDLDVVVVANVDGDAADEILYTQGYTRGNATDRRMPLIVLDQQFTPVSVKNESSSVPADFYVDQNYPNPFNPSTTIKFGLTEMSNVDLRVYNALGAEVAVLVSGEQLSAGSYSVKFDAAGLSSGIYFYRLTAGANSVTRKMQLLK